MQNHRSHYGIFICIIYLILSPHTPVYISSSLYLFLVFLFSSLISFPPLFFLFPSYRVFSFPPPIIFQPLFLFLSFKNIHTLHSDHILFTPRCCPQLNYLFFSLNQKTYKNHNKQNPQTQSNAVYFLDQSFQSIGFTLECGLLSLHRKKFVFPHAEANNNTKL